MPGIHKRNAVIVLGLAALLYWSFMFAKHNPLLRGIIPFGEDPYDAIGSFGSVLGIILALLSLVRSLRPYREGSPTIAQLVYLIRSQEAVVLAALITVAADMIAMARHPRIWAGAAARSELIALLSALVIFAIATQLLLCASKRKLRLVSIRSMLWVRAALAVILGISILAIYPEWLVNNISTHLLTIAVGAFVLFAPMRILLIAFVPYETVQGTQKAQMSRNIVFSEGFRWGMILFLGAIIGICAFVSELMEGGAPPIRGLLFVGSVYVGVGLGGFFLAYLFLKEPLGLGAR